jgi:hypothetical protein
MEFLKRAEDYTSKRGDYDIFVAMFKKFRQRCSVSDSIFCALSWLYDEDTANLLQYKYCEVIL